MYNTEIKAKVNDPELLISRVKQLTNVDCIIIKQHDTFFKVSDGRLKLRQFEVKVFFLILDYYMISEFLQFPFNFIKN